MRSRKKSTISAPEVQAVASGWIQDHLKLSDYSVKCTWSVILSVLLFAASRTRSIHEACQRLSRAPSDETIRQALLATLPSSEELERRVNGALADRLPKGFFKRTQRIAFDLTEIAYHGRPYRDAREVRRGKPKSGTSHFHVYASAYVVRHGQRFTLAATRVLAGETMDVVVARLLRQVRRIGVKVRFLLLDKGFFSVEVVRYLQAARCPFLMPAFARGKKSHTPRPGSLRAYQARKRSGWEHYTWTNPQGRRASVSLAIVCKNYHGQRGRHGRRTQLYACWGLPRRSAAWVCETYRSRFGIETSYRQMNEGRIRTSTRNPLVRFLYVAIALILRNVWVWCHLNWLAVRRGPGIILREELLRLGEMLLWLQHQAQERFGLCVCKDIPPPKFANAA
jgi:hypothetical protein